jgi:hypothetical protein
MACSLRSFIGIAPLTIDLRSTAASRQGHPLVASNAAISSHVFAFGRSVLHNIRMYQLGSRALAQSKMPTAALGFAEVISRVPLVGAQR